MLAVGQIDRFAMYTRHGFLGRVRRNGRFLELDTRKRITKLQVDILEPIGPHSVPNFIVPKLRTTELISPLKLKLRTVLSNGAERAKPHTLCSLQGGTCIVRAPGVTGVTGGIAGDRHIRPKRAHLWLGYIVRG